MNAKRSAKSITRKSPGFTAEERAAMRERAHELRTKKGDTDGETELLAKIAAMLEPDRTMATRIHAIVKASAPVLSPTTWYGMPAYAKDGKGCLLLPERAEVQDEVRDVWLQRQSEPRRGRHVAKRLCAQGADCRRGSEDRRAREEGSELSIAISVRGWRELARTLTAGPSRNINGYMNRDSRLSVALHVLLHMGESGGALTSDVLGSMLEAHPVVIRRTLAGLRDAGIVAAEKGHGGGWSLARDLGSVSLADVYDAIGPATVFGIGPRDPKPTCPIERAVNLEIGAALQEAEAVLMKRLRSVAVADVLKNARRRRRSA